MTGEEFVAFAKQLRELGAVRLKAGELEVHFHQGPSQLDAGALKSRLDVQRALRGLGDKDKPQPMTPQEARLWAYKQELEGGTE